jgi:hypothetical protein
MVRCSSDSGHIAALPRTGGSGQQQTYAVQQMALLFNDLIGAQTAERTSTRPLAA